MHRELWRDDSHETAIYVATNGLSTPKITNYLSDVLLSVVMGSGYVITWSGDRQVLARVAEGDYVNMSPGVPYQYGGDMELLVSLQPGLIPELVTFDDERLSANGKRILRAMAAKNRESITDMLLRRFSSRFLAFQYLTTQINESSLQLSGDRTD